MKKQYIKPVSQIMAFDEESLMITASPGVGGDYDPSISVEAKGGGLFGNYDDINGSNDFKLTIDNNLWD